MNPFNYTSRAFRVVFGRGTIASLGAEIESFKLERALVLSTPEQRDVAESLARALGPRAAGVHPHAAMHTPVAVTERAITVVRALAMMNPYWNPRSLTREGIRELIARAWAGETPVS